MSALARWLKSSGVEVAGYDKTPSQLTVQLQQEGISVYFDEQVDAIPADFMQPGDDTVVVYTPAIPAQHQGLQYFKSKGYALLKRSELLGRVASEYHTLAVAGTHGKTTTSAMLTWLMHRSNLPVGAFLGGISSNLNSNMLAPSSAENSFLVVEADEFDRSFLTLHPQAAVVTSTDADHLDIYGNHDHVLEGFREFVSQIRKDGFLFSRHGLGLSTPDQVKNYTYGNDPEAAIRAVNIRIEQGFFMFDFVSPMIEVSGLKLGMPGLHNIENALAALGMAIVHGADPVLLKEALAEFKGVQRRFDIKYRSESMIYIDDYAHHPTEIEACIQSVRFMFPGRKITAIFQPHLFTRTRDFFQGFADSLSLADEVLLMDIYPARELPIAGVTSEIIFNQLKSTQKKLITHDSIISEVSKVDQGVLLTLGAGDIDRWVETISNELRKKNR